MKKKIHRLEGIESYDFGLVGLSTPENDYRITWILNNAMGYSLSRDEDLRLKHKRLEEPQTFHQFRYFDEDTLLLYRLISNKCEHGYLLEEMTNVDFLVQVSGELPSGFIDTLARDLNALPEVSLAFRIDPAGLKSRDRLLM
jgi:hypothetical protein